MNVYDLHAIFACAYMLVANMPLFLSKPLKAVQQIAIPCLTHGKVWEYPKDMRVSCICIQFCRNTKHVLVSNRFSVNSIAVSICLTQDDQASVDRSILDLARGRRHRP